jgi:hypothetical protein
MPDIDSNGVDILDRFLAYKSRFMQFSVTEDVFNQVVAYIKELRKERDEARQMYCKMTSRDNVISARYIADRHGWDCFKEDGNA